MNFSKKIHNWFLKGMTTVAVVSYCGVPAYVNSLGFMTVAVIELVCLFWVLSFCIANNFFLKE